MHCTKLYCICPPTNIVEMACLVGVQLNRNPICRTSVWLPQLAPAAAPLFSVCFCSNFHTPSFLGSSNTYSTPAPISLPASARTTDAVVVVVVHAAAVATDSLLPSSPALSLSLSMWRIESTHTHLLRDPRGVFGGKLKISFSSLLPSSFSAHKAREAATHMCVVLSTERTSPPSGRDVFDSAAVLAS